MKQIRIILLLTMSLLCTNTMYGEENGTKAGPDLSSITVLDLGTAQQIALAIQNHHFQSEIIERERLEREMQLAREIQQSFLPRDFPDLKKWDLKAKWHPAYEVGGDFYDFFSLPNQRLGLVIADVADKGMPAALFMTLIRTLIRSTVQQIQSFHGIINLLPRTRSVL